MKSFLLLLVLGNTISNLAVAQVSNVNGRSAISSHRGSTGGGRINLGTTEDGQEGYFAAIGGQGPWPLFGGAGVGRPYSDGGVSRGVGNGIGSGSIGAYFERLRTGRSDWRADIPPEPSARGAGMQTGSGNGLFQSGSRPMASRGFGTGTGFSGLRATTQSGGGFQRHSFGPAFIIPSLSFGLSSGLGFGSRFMF